MSEISGGEKAGRSKERLALLGVAWVLIMLLALSLLGVAVALLFKMEFFSSGALNDEKIKSLWAFLGVALGAVATIFVALLAEENNQRASGRAELELKQQKTLAEETEKRLAFDTAAKVLELISDNDEDSQRAKIAAAVAAMMQLGNAAIAIRITDELWSADKIDAGTAVWVIEHAFDNRLVSDDDKTVAAEVLFDNYSKLVPSKDAENQTWYEWPSVLAADWPTLPAGTKNILVATAVKVLLIREPDFWKRLRGSVFPVQTLLIAIDDDAALPNLVSQPAAGALVSLYEAGFLEDAGVVLDSGSLDKVKTLAGELSPAPWFSQLLSEVAQWNDGNEPVRITEIPSPSRLSVDVPEANS